MTFLNAKIKESLIILFVREFSIMIGAGLPIISSLEILHKNQYNKKFANIISLIKEAIEQGETLSDAFSYFPKYFDQFFIGMLSAGEASGDLEATLKNIADYFIYSIYNCSGVYTYLCNTCFSKHIFKFRRQPSLYNSNCYRFF